MKGFFPKLVGGISLFVMGKGDVKKATPNHLLGWPWC